MGSSKKIFSGVIWSVITNIVNALYGFIAIPILINHFGKAEYGLIALATSVNGYMHLMDMGLGSTNVRFFAAWIAEGDKSRVRKLFSTSNAFYSVIGIINAIVLAILYIFADNVFNVSQEQCATLRNLLLILIAASVVNWYTSCFNQIIQATENVAWTQKRLLATKCLLIIVLIATVFLNLTVTQYFFLTILSVWVILPFVIKKIKTVAPFVSFRPWFDIKVFKEILPYSLNIFSFSIFSVSFRNLRTIFLGIQGTVDSVTDFSVIFNISQLCSMISGVFLSSLLPSSSKAIAEGNKEAYDKIAYQGTKYIMAFVAFCVFGLMTIGGDLIDVYVGDSFLYLVPWLNILLLTLLTNHILGISSLILGGTNILPLSKMTAVSSVLGLLVAWFLIPKYQVGGVVIATVAYDMCQLFFYYLYFWPKIMKIDSFRIFKTIFLPLAIMGGACFLATLIIPRTDNGWINIFMFGAVYSALFVLSVNFYFNREDKLFLKGLLIRKRKK